MSQRIANRELRELARTARKQGWTVQFRRGGHLIWRSPRGAAVYSSATPGDPNAFKKHRDLLVDYGLEL